MDGSSVEFGISRLNESMLKSAKNSDATRLEKILIEDMYAFTNGLPLKDDYTLVVMDIE